MIEAAWAVGAAILACQAGIIEKELIEERTTAATIELAELEKALAQFEQAAL